MFYNENMLKNIAEMPFSAILNTLLGEYVGANRLLEDKTILLGKKISMRSIQRYRAGESVPSLEDALFIIEACNNECELEELKKCLQLSRDINRGILQDHVLVRKITLNGQDFSLPLNEDEIIDIILERIHSLFPDDKKAFSKYVSLLIEKDIKDNIIKEGENAKKEIKGV